jgi:ankyrin repeat protein
MNIKLFHLGMFFAGTILCSQSIPQYSTYSTKSFKQLTNLEKTALKQYFYDFVIKGGADHAWQNNGPTMTTINKWEIVDSWLEKGIEPNWQYGPEQISLLHLAVRSGKASLVEKLFTLKAKANIFTIKLETPLHWVKPDDAECQTKIDLLLSHGAKINSKDQYGMTPLHKFVFEYVNNPSGYGRLIGTLLKKGADVNLAAQGGITPLMSAVNKLDLVDILVKNGANVNAKDDSKFSALDKAREIRSTLVESYLLAHGAK